MYIKLVHTCIRTCTYICIHILTHNLCVSLVDDKVSLASLFLSTTTDRDSNILYYIIIINICNIYINNS